MLVRSESTMMASPRSTDLPSHWNLKSNNLDFIRLFFASLVIFNHSFVIARGARSPDPLAAATGGALDFGELAVDGFFIISGFLVSQSWLNSAAIGTYIKKRALRIVPGFIAAFLVCALVVIPLGSGSWHVFVANFRLPKLVAALLLFRQYTQANAFTAVPFAGAVNGSFWTIQFECWCYALVPLLSVIGVYRRRWLAIGLCAATMIIFERQSQGHLHLYIGVSRFIFGEPTKWPRLLFCFLCGVGFYSLKERIPYRAGLAIACGTILVAMGMFASRQLSLAAPLFGTYILLFLAFRPSPRFKSAARFGDFSYGTYLYGFPVQQLILYYLGECGVGRHVPRIGPYELTLLALPATLLVAALSWYCVERPFLRFRRTQPTAPRFAAGANMTPIQDLPADTVIVGSP